MVKMENFLDRTLQMFRRENKRTSNTYKLNLYGPVKLTVMYLSKSIKNG